MDANPRPKIGQFPLSEWRLLLTPPAEGTWNMAVDETLLEEMASENAIPILRLYAWQPPCLSLGYAQPFSDVDEVALDRMGWQVVRRPTGGRAILHTDELTYAVIAPHSEPRLSGGVLESYQRLSATLLDALHRIQIPAKTQAQAVSPAENHSASQDSKGPVCFEVPSNYEITIDGKKLIGSAQRRQREGVLQHGTLPLYGDLKRILTALHFKDEIERVDAGQRLERRAATVASSLAINLSWEAAAQAFIEAFIEVLNLRLIPSNLSQSELQRVEELVRDKYANPSWTKRV